MSFLTTFPPVTEPPWVITGGAEKESVSPSFEFLQPGGHLQSYYSLHAQIWEPDWGLKEEELNAGDAFVITTEVEVLKLDKPKLMRTYLQAGDVHSGGEFQIVSPGKNVFVAKGVYIGHGGSYVLTVQNKDWNVKSTILFKILSVKMVVHKQ